MKITVSWPIQNVLVTRIWASKDRLRNAPLKNNYQKTTAKYLKERLPTLEAFTDNLRIIHLVQSQKTNLQFLLRTIQSYGIFNVTELPHAVHFTGNSECHTSKKKKIVHPKRCCGQTDGQSICALPWSSGLTEEKHENTFTGWVTPWHYRRTSQFQVRHITTWPAAFLVLK